MKQRSKKKTPKNGTTKFVVVFVALAVLLVGILGVSALQKPQGKGELAFEKESVDVGNVPLGQTVTQRWTMRNVGDGPLTIAKTNVETLEGC